MRALSYEATVQSQEAVARAVAPLHETLRRYEIRVAELERDRVDAYAELREQVRSMSTVSGELRTETKQLVAALRAPQVRGRWGEHQLRRIVEAAGMLEHCDFSEQVTAATDLAGVRPDLVVRLHGGRSVVVDAKAPFDAYLAAMEARDERGRDAHLDASTPGTCGCTSTSWRRSPTGRRSPSRPSSWCCSCRPTRSSTWRCSATRPCLEHAFARNVVLATPATLVALLRTVAYSWRQEALARNAVAVHDLARELYGRLSTLGDHVGKLGSSLGSAVTAYNKAVGSLEARVLVSARKLAELGVSGDDIETPAQVEITPRQLQAPELLADATLFDLADPRGSGAG